MVSVGDLASLSGREELDALGASSGKAIASPRAFSARAAASLKRLPHVDQPAEDDSGCSLVLPPVGVFKAACGELEDGVF